MLRRCLPLVGLVLASMSTSPAAAEAQLVRLVIDTTYYRVRGSTADEWRVSMDAGARAAGLPQPAIAYTRWQTWWSPEPYVSTPSGCVSGVRDVEVRISYTMPHLVPGPEASPADVREWRRYVEAVWRHEEGHATRALRAGIETRDSLIWIRGSTCAELHARLSPALQAVWAKYKALQVAYDVRHNVTERHGGLRLPRTWLLVDTTFPDTLP